MAYCHKLACTNPFSDNDSTCPSCRGHLLLSGRYLPVSILGQGGFGRTYKAIDTHHPQQKLCVIKQFNFTSTDPTSQKTAIDLFYNEAQHLMDLDHPQIPKLIDFFDMEGQPYIIQEFIDGSDLEKTCKINVFSESEVQELLESLLPVLNYLHNQTTPVIHRDIKPANIIRRNLDGLLFLVDFGAIKTATQTTLAKTGTSIGSAEYVAPEQVRGKATFASDIYSLGVTCIHLLTSVSPFDLLTGDGDWAWRNFLDDNHVSNRLSRIINKMIDQRLSKRYVSANDVMQDLYQINFDKPLSSEVIALQDNLVAEKVEATLQEKSFFSKKIIKYPLVFISVPTAIYLAVPIAKSIHITPLSLFALTQSVFPAIVGIFIIAHLLSAYRSYQEQYLEGTSKSILMALLCLPVQYFTPQIFQLIRFILGI
jgi:serine/threonine protein kinase